MSPQEAARRRQQSQRDREQEQHRRDEHRHDEARFQSDLENHRVLSFREWCRLCGISVGTGRRLINSGNAPVITQLSPRRIGIRLADHLAWQASRARGVA
jgi:predicted DNA-binding transcriptional regulator AlpA